jgi:hypothetical protein
MSLIPQLMSGRKLEHDLKFASDGPISGLVEGVQSADLGDATTTLVLKETSTSGELQMKASTLALDPTAADRIVKLPAAITDGPDLAGRRIVIRNTSDNRGEHIRIFESDGTTFVAYLGFDQCVEIFFTAQGKPFVVNDLFCATAVISDGTDTEVVPALGTAYVAIPERAIVIGVTAGNAVSYKLRSGSTDLGVSEAETLADSAIIVNYGANNTAAATSLVAANAAIKFQASSDPGTAIAVRIYFRVFKADQSTAALAAMS